MNDREREDRARGAERKWIMAVRRFLKKVETSKTVYHIVHLLSRRPCPIASGHALEGVRCNGTQRLVTAMRVKRELVQYKNSLLEDARLLTIAAHQASEEIDALTNEWDINWDECRDCKGRGGYWENNETGKRVYEDDARQGYRWTWRDCEKCNGRGMCEGF